LVPLLGYERAASLAKQALAEGRTVRELAMLTGLLTELQLDEVLHPAKLAG
jgi:fumarate hydratase class II